MLNELTSILKRLPVLADHAELAAAIIACLAILLASCLAFVISRSVIVSTIRRIVEKTPSERDDILVRHKAFSRIAQLVPAFIIYLTMPAVLAPWPALSGGVVTLCLIYIIVIGALFLDSLINAGLEFYSTFRVSKDFPITSFGQVGKMLVYFIAFISVLALLLGQSPMTLFAGLGALTAVLMLVFKDPILGLVAGIQLSANRMVAVGDWIEMPKFGVDGDVMEIALTTVKIRNFDKTITTVPTQALISDSFKNWRGMKETGGRRIKRSIYIDMSSIKFCDGEMLQRFSKIQYIAEYIAKTQEELDRFNGEKGADMQSLVNGRRMTNVGTFRAYIEAYLFNHPKISKSLTFLVRQLQPTENGLPIEIYVFSLDTNWIAYEKIQADIFDHILAVAREFDLVVFQNPTGLDFRNLAA